MTGDSPNGFGPRSQTILRPQPGGRAGARPTDLAARPGPTPAQSGRAAIEDFIVRAENPYLAAAGPLLSLGASLGATVYQADVEGLRRQLFDSIKSFESQTLSAGLNPREVSIARYIICTFLDSAIFQTPWGGQNVWGPRSLLLTFHNEAQGGERFFTILDALRSEPRKHVDLLELQYVCLALGFLGKYRMEPNGRSVVQGLQTDVYRLIRSIRPGPGNSLSERWQGVAKPRVQLLRLVPVWIVAVAGFGIVVATVIVLRTRLSHLATPTIAALAVRGIDTGYALPPPAQPNRLEALLAAQIRDGQVRVEEFGHRTVITPLIPDLFRSGSATAMPQFHALFAAIGRALDQDPGRILIVGHTDDTPVRSFRFADNFELSRARAISIASLMRAQIRDPSRIEWSGVGATQPRYLPPSTSANRARNRRVEITLIGE